MEGCVRKDKHFEVYLELSPPLLRICIVAIDGVQDKPDPDGIHVIV